jgi:hypothetical protein
VGKTTAASEEKPTGGNKKHRMSQEGGGEPPGPETDASPESRIAQGAGAVGGVGAVGVGAGVGVGTGAGAGAVGEERVKHEAVQIVLGRQYDVLDASQRWCEAEVLRLDPSDRNRVLVTYVYWVSNFDEWIDNVAER